MRTLVTIILCAWIFGSRAQVPLNEEKVKGATTYYASGTQTVVTGRIFTTANGNISKVAGSITIKGYSKDITINENGFYFVEISELVKSNKKIVITCKAKNYKTQEQVIKRPFTNEYNINFELVRKK